jgi:hypothetical protein
MVRLTAAGRALSVVLLTAGWAAAQPSTATSLSELMALRDKVGNADTRVRVDAMYRVRSIALASNDAEVKMASLDLLREPVGSASDHIRMPAVYAIAEVANSTDDPRVKVRALGTLAEPLQASQVPIRVVAIDAVNSITRSAKGAGIALAAVRALVPAVRSGNNGVRIPAINAVVRAVEDSQDGSAQQEALDLFTAALDSSGAIGGMEVRMMAVAAVEKVGLAAADVGTKAKAMGLLQAYGSRGSWEPEARARAQNAAAKVEASVRKP